jgi:hypothetical protein
MEGLNAGGPKCGAALSAEYRVLRQTSGALRQTEGSWRPRRARTKRKSVTHEVLDPHGRRPAPGAREILRPERHLRGIRNDAPRERRTGRRKIPNQGNGLNRVGRNHPVRTLTAPTSLAANLRQSGLRRFSLRQSRDGDVAARGSAKNAIAKNFPQICHAAERFLARAMRHFAGASPAGKPPSSPASCSCAWRLGRRMPR